MASRDDTEAHRALVTISKKLDEALDLLDIIGRGDGDCAASIERAVQRAKRKLRTEFGRHSVPLPPLPSHVPSSRGGVRGSKSRARPLRTNHQP